MRRIGQPGGTCSRTTKLVLALAILAQTAMGAAQSATPDVAPKLPYAAYPADDRLTLSGKLVRSESEDKREAALWAEIARVRASQNYEPHPAIWKIGDADTTIYLFGTVHSLPPGFRWRNPVLEGVVVRANLLLLESVDEQDHDVTFREGIAPDTVAAMPPLLDRVSHRFRGKLAALQALLPPETVAEMDRMPTWIAAMGVGYIRDLLVGDMPSDGADDWLEKHFRATGRPIEAIEQAKQVVTNINAVPESAQRLMLEAAVAAPDRSRAELDAPAHAWAQGEVGDDSPLKIVPQELDPQAKLADPLLAQRNAAWVETLLGKEMARPGTILFAAGAGHFVGPGSVIDLLRRRGVRVERVQ
ncbi:TraB/GumN family protein [Sphingomonas sp.]|uniref:TraB/GumN family protein n=1 Tax=Sphingomonas sp. TaxID=28214 RepID=UPI001B2EBFBC|nr:TraB/GumN family protein [Sphingomonas sp.]MBO9711335.1 TraB/GumN family protein [Sphingomonas sp.]